MGLFGEFGKRDPMAAAEEALKKRGWKFDRMDAETLLAGVRTAFEHHYLISIRHDVDRKTVLFLLNLLNRPAGFIQAIAAGHLPFLRVHSAVGHSQEQVAGVCKVLMEENYRLVLGNFERDEKDGEIRFRIALPYRDTNLTVEQVNWCIDIAVGTLEVVMPKIEEAIGAEVGQMVV